MTDAASALENLGFKPAVAAQAVARALEELGEGASEGDLIRVALKKADHIGALFGQQWTPFHLPATVQPIAWALIIGALSFLVSALLHQIPFVKKYFV